MAKPVCDQDLQAAAAAAPLQGRVSPRKESPLTSLSFLHGELRKLILHQENELRHRLDELGEHLEALFERALQQAGEAENSSRQMSEQMSRSISESKSSAQQVSEQASRSIGPMLPKIQSPSMPIVSDIEHQPAEAGSILTTCIVPAARDSKNVISEEGVHGGWDMGGSSKTSERISTEELARLQNRGKQASSSLATEDYAQDAHMHWRRMIRKKYNKRLTQPLTKVSQHEMADDFTFLQQVVHSRTYELSSLVLVFLNAAFIGWQVEYFAVHFMPLPQQSIGEYVFCVLFTLELIMRLLADGIDFFIGKDFGWDMFDTVVVVAMWAEQLIDATSNESSPLLKRITSLRVLRVIRVIRVLKIIRVLRFFRELRMMVHSILSSIKSCIWAVMVQSVMFFIFGVGLTQGVVEYCTTNNAWTTSDTQEMRRHFGTLGRSVISLFQAMTGGISWGELLDALALLHESFTVLFLIYIFFAVFAVTNIVTAVFVEGAMLNAQLDHEVIIQEQMSSFEAYLESMQHVFHDLDKDTDGLLRLDELRKAVKDERVVAYFNAFGLDITDVQTLFVLLDRDRKGVIDIDEFLLGCMRLKGEAKSLDVAKLLYECDWMVHNIESLTAGMEHVQLFLKEKHGLRIHSFHTEFFEDDSW